MRFLRLSRSLPSLVVIASLLASPLALAQEKAAGADAKAPAAPAWKAKKKKATKDPGPIAHFPGFEMLPDGGSRVFVDVTKKIEVTEQIAAGTVTYVLKDTNVESYNDLHALETYYHPTPVIRVRLRRVKKETSLHIALRGDVKPTYRIVEQRDGGVRLEVDFPPGAAGKDGDPIPPDAPATPATSPRNVPKVKKK